MPNATAQIRMYPRGFLGDNFHPQTSRTPNRIGQEMKRFQYHAEGMIGTDKAPQITANPYVEALYAQMIKRTGNISSFEYREQILSAALAAFGTHDFQAWFETQFKSPACGEIHRRFLDDTLKFISEGRREMSLETWNALVLITDEGNPIGVMSEYSKKFFGGQMNDGIIRQRLNYKLTDIIQDWCSKPNGLEDLLGTLHILFGNP